MLKIINFKSILAGILIGFGVIINVQSEYAPLGALLFSFGLLTIINMGLPLYTGRIGFLKGNLFEIIFWNFVGIALVVGFYIASNPDFSYLLAAAAASKFSKSLFTLTMNGVFCGALIHLAVKNKTTILTIFAVMIFILIGAEHCIADYPYLLALPSISNAIKLGGVVLGNSIGAILVERLSEVGNE